MALALIGLGLSLAFAWAWLTAMARPTSPLLPFTDANTYVAAGERLNAGHQLYTLVPGDRWVDLVPGNPSPLFSPPSIAVLWRPLATVPVGLSIWVIGAWLSMLLIPLIVRGGGWVAGLLKVYALVPLVFLGKWRHVGATLLWVLATIPLLPWNAYLANLGAISGHLSAQTGYGLTLQQSAWLVLPALMAFAAIGRTRAAWLAVPALWPSQQWYYASLALPVQSALVGAIIAVPIAGSGALALFVYAVVTLFARRRRARAMRMGRVEDE